MVSFDVKNKKEKKDELLRRVVLKGKGKVAIHRQPSRNQWKILGLCFQTTYVMNFRGRVILKGKRSYDFSHTQSRGGATDAS